MRMPPFFGYPMQSPGELRSSRGLSALTEVVGSTVRDAKFDRPIGSAPTRWGKLRVFKTSKVFHVMNTRPTRLLGKIQRLRLVGAIEKSEANAV